VGGPERGRAVKPAPFAYDDPGSLAEALDLLARHGDEAKVLAGGQSLVPLMNFRLARPERLVDVNRIDELAFLREEDGALRIGALTRTVELERSPLVAGQWPLLAEAARLVGHTAIRTRGTVGGSVAHADPAAELPAALTALGAVFRARSARGPRDVDAQDFFFTHLTTVLEPDELLVEIVVPPLAPGSGTAIVEHTRVHGDFALGGAAVVLGESPSVVLLAAGPTPVRAVAVEEALVAGAGAGEAAELADEAVDVVAEADFRRALAVELTRRALTVAAERAAA
jgi:CO/xanthine dehydrogenase FAD-binding subunit